MLMQGRREERGGKKSSSISLLGQDSGTGFNSSYSSTYVRGKRVMEKGKEGKTKWGSCSSSSAGSQDHLLEEGFSKEHLH